MPPQDWQIVTLSTPTSRISILALSNSTCPMMMIPMTTRSTCLISSTLPTIRPFCTVPLLRLPALHLSWPIMDVCSRRSTIPSTTHTIAYSGTHVSYSRSLRLSIVKR
jgi:hypothetical protein